MKGGVGARIKLALPWIALAALLAVHALGLGANIVRLLFITFVWVTTSLAWNLLGGLAGQVSFGFAVFYGLGAYAAALLIDAGVSPYFSFFAAGRQRGTDRVRRPASASRLAADL